MWMPYQWKLTLKLNSNYSHIVKIPAIIKSSCFQTEFILEKEFKYKLISNHHWMHSLFKVISNIKDKNVYSC